MIQSLPVQQNTQAQVLPSQVSVQYQTPQRWDATNDTSQSTGNINQYQQLFQKTHMLLDNSLKTLYCLSNPFWHILQTLFLPSNSLKNNLTYSRSIMMVSYGLTRRGYSSWFSRIMKTCLLILKASEEHSDLTIFPTTSSL